MSMRTWTARAAVVLVLSVPGVGLAANALVVHDGTAGLEANVLLNLTTKLTAATFTVTPNVGVPGGSLAGYQQIWDIRFNNTTPLTAGDMTAYSTFLQGGGSLFLMGENTGFITRDNSIASFVSSVGGGSLVIQTPANTEIVNSPFTGPNPLAGGTITFLAAAGSQVYGTGTWVARDPAAIAAAIVWPPGTLAAAPSGALITVFDVNFLDPGADANSQAFTQNLIAYLAAPTAVGPQPVPALSTWAMLALGLALAAAAVKFIGFRAG
jgi:hypothetical protein